MTDTANTTRPETKHVEKRHVVIYGYGRNEISKLMTHFKTLLPDNIHLAAVTEALVTTVTLTGKGDGLDLLRFQINKHQQNLCELFPQEVLTLEAKTPAQVLGELLTERELTVACAESCTGGNVAHRITQVPGSSVYFLGSVVSYSNSVKASVLKVPRQDIDRMGPVSKEVAEAMAKGICTLMRSDCGIATTGIAGPDGGTKFKPVGTVWVAVKCLDRVVSECVLFKGDRNEVIEAATNHGLVMLINLLRNSYVMQEDFNDE